MNPTQFIWGNSNMVSVFYSQAHTEEALQFLEWAAMQPSPKIVILGEALELMGGYDREQHQQVCMGADYTAFQALMLVGNVWDMVSTPKQQQMATYSHAEMANKTLQHLNLSDTAIYVNFCTDTQLQGLF